MNNIIDNIIKYSINNTIEVELQIAKWGQKECCINYTNYKKDWF